jgi:hypothetical protein
VPTAATVPTATVSLRLRTNGCDTHAGRYCTRHQ